MKNKEEKVIFFQLLSLFLFPTKIFAAKSLADISREFIDFLNIFPPILVGLALIYFFYGLSGYVYGLDDKKKAEAKTIMIWGVLGLFVMISIGGIIELVRGIFGI